MSSQRSIKIIKKFSRIRWKLPKRATFWGYTSKLAVYDVIGVQIIINTRFVDSIVVASVENLQKSGYNNISVEYIRNSYLASFIEMARKGFYSYDRYLNDESIYALVCGPDKPVSVGMKLLEMSNEIELSNEESFFLVKTKFDEE